MRGMTESDALKVFLESDALPLRQMPAVKPDGSG